MRKSYHLRKPILDDGRFVYALRFLDMDVVNSSWSKNIPEISEHDKYFSEHCDSYRIIVVDCKRVGFIRIVDGEVSIALVRKHRGKQLGSKVLSDIKEGMATVRYGNLASFHCFVNAGFKPVGWIMKKEVRK